MPSKPLDLLNLIVAFAELAPVPLQDHVRVQQAAKELREHLEPKSE